MPSAQRSSLFLIAATLFAVSCGGVSAEQACADSAKASCAKLDQCRHNGTQNSYGTLGNCITRVQHNCVVALAAIGSGNSPAATEACAQALPAETCQDYLQGNPVPACQQKKGAQRSSAGCAFSGQCQTGFCGVSKGSLCGTCANLPVAGDPCVEDTACGPNMLCTGQQVCEPYVASGGNCDNKTLDCAPGLSCVIPAMGMLGTCTPMAGPLDASCDYKRQTGPGCNGNTGLFCASTNKCTAIAWVKAGTTCGVMMSGTVDNACTNGTGCYGAMPAMGGTPAVLGTCAALGNEGDACDLDAAIGPGCMSPDRCVVSGSGTAGACAAPDPAKCL